jgi:hypothetical protein
LPTALPHRREILRRNDSALRVLGADDSEGCILTPEWPRAWFDKRHHTLRARGVILAAGEPGMNDLLAKGAFPGALRGLSDRLWSPLPAFKLSATISRRAGSI